MPLRSVSITTLGQTWLIIPEIIGFLRPDIFDFYANHKFNDQLKDLLKKNLEFPAERLVIISTDNKKLVAISEEISQWLTSINPSNFDISFIIPDKMADIISEDDARLMRACIMGSVLNAKREIGDSGKLYLSLTGGRKTMSSDLQLAASVFGCDHLFHILDNITNEYKGKIFNLRATDLGEPLKEDLSSLFLPTMIGHYPNQLPIQLFQRTPCFEILKEKEVSPFVKIQYIQPNVELLEQIEDLFYSGLHYSFNLNQSEFQKKYPEHFKILYSLHADQLKNLEKIQIGTSPDHEREDFLLLKKLPKIDLHFHLGGSLSVTEMIQVSTEEENAIRNYRKEHNEFDDFLQKIENMIKFKDLNGMRKFLFTTLNNQEEKVSSDTIIQFKKLRSLFSGIPQHIIVSGFLSRFQDNPDLLEELIFSDFLHEENYAGIGIQLYEQLGDLQGSALLQSEKIIKRTVQIVCENSIEENIKYLEIRCSPLNYTRGNLKGLDVYKIICDTLEEYKGQLRSKLLIIASRHSELSKIQAHMDLISEIFKSGDPYLSYLAGVDLAGNENAMEPEKLREPFLSAMEKNIHITIHAGETADVNNIWQAIYHLNAERIGHGLTLKNDKSLMKKILDRKIGIEMCPSSNTQIVGFRDFYKNKSDHFEEYPLKEYLDNKLKVTINTDNTGISRTSISKEFLKACHLTENGLSIPEILQIIKNSIDSSFLSYDEKLKLTNEIETEIIEFLRRDILCQNSSWLARAKS